MPPRAHRSCYSAVLFWAAIVGSGSGSGCQPRPQFKVSLTDIPDGTNNLLARVWLVKQPDASMAAGIFGPAGIAADTVDPASPAYLTQRVPLPPCAVGDPTCTAGNRQYSFGVDFDDGLVASHPMALVSVAAVNTSVVPGSGATQDCLLSVATSQQGLGGKGPVNIDVLTLSLLKGAIQSTKCVDVTQPVQAGVNPSPVVSGFDVNYASVLGADKVARVMTIDGWNFQPGVTVTLDDRCMNQVPMPRYGAPVTDPTAAEILYVTPSEIAISLGSALALDCMTHDCAVMTVTVDGAPMFGPMKLYPKSYTPMNCPP